MKRSRLYDEHSKRGASFIEQGGWEVSAHYGDATAEHLAARRGVGVTDLSQRGKLRVTGDDRVKWLQSVIRDRKSTRLNSSHLVISYAVFCLKKKKKSINQSYLQ